MSSIRLRIRGGILPDKTVSYQSDDASHPISGEFGGSEANHSPFGQRGLEGFFQVGNESRRSVVAAIDVDPALDFNQGFRFEVGKSARHFRVGWNLNSFSNVCPPCALQSASNRFSSLLGGLAPKRLQATAIPLSRSWQS